MQSCALTECVTPAWPLPCWPALCAGNAVVNVYINKEKNFAFVEFRTGALNAAARCVSGGEKLTFRDI